MCHAGTMQIVRLEKKKFKKTGEMDVGKISLRTGQVKSHLLLIWVRNNHTIKEFKVRQG